MSNLRQLILDTKPVPGIDQETPTVRQALKAAGLNPDTCDVFLLENEGDEGKKVPLDHILDLRKVGEMPGKPVRLRCVPNDRNAG